MSVKRGRSKEYNDMVKEERVMRCESVEFNSLGEKANIINRWKKEFFKIHSKNNRYEIHTEDNLIMFIYEEKLVS